MDLMPGTRTRSQLPLTGACTRGQSDSRSTAHVTDVEEVGVSGVRDRAGTEFPLAATHLFDFRGFDLEPLADLRYDFHDPVEFAR